VVAQISADYLRFRPSRVVPRLLSYALFEGRPLLTRGRWINPLVTASLHAWRRLPRLRTVRRPVFIVGTGRSGTTILGVLLSLHRDIGFLNEPKAIWHAIHPAEDLIGSYARGAARYRLDASDADETTRETAHRIYGAYALLTACTRVVDKYPELIYRSAFVRALFPDARFLVLVRNGWDACRSVDSWSAGHSRGAGSARIDWWGVNGRKWLALIEQVAGAHADLAAQVGELRGLGRDVDRAAVEWLLSMREALALAGSYPDDVLLVRYETLTARAFTELERILGFCEVADDCALRRHAGRVLACHAGGEPLPLHPLVAGPFESTMRRLGYA
jgi:hypothetical protein